MGWEFEENFENVEVGSSLTTVEDDSCSQGDSLKRFKHGKMKLHKEVKTFWVAMSAKSSD